MFMNGAREATYAMASAANAMGLEKSMLRPARGVDAAAATSDGGSGSSGAGGSQVSSAGADSGWGASAASGGAAGVGGAPPLASSSVIRREALPYRHHPLYRRDVREHGQHPQCPHDDAVGDDERAAEQQHARGAREQTLAQRQAEALGAGAGVAHHDRADDRGIAEHDGRRATGLRVVVEQAAEHRR